VSAAQVNRRALLSGLVRWRSDFADGLPVVTLVGRIGNQAPRSDDLMRAAIALGWLHRAGLVAKRRWFGVSVYRATPAGRREFSRPQVLS
jgi:hypothetical protein